MPKSPRPAAKGDSVTIDFTVEAGGKSIEDAGANDLTIEVGSGQFLPEIEAALLDKSPGDRATAEVRMPAQHPHKDLRGKTAHFAIEIKELKERVLPELDDEFAKDLGEFETLDALRARVREDLEHQARHKAESEIRSDLMKQLSLRVPFDVPPSLLEREIDRRIEDFAHRLIEQNIDPRQAGIDWTAFRESQRDTAREAVAGAIVLDEVARREHLDVTEEEIEREIGRYAERSGRAPAAVRAGLEKEGGLSRVAAGLRREKSIDFLLARATIAGEL